MFVTLPTALDVRLCLMTNGHLCMFKQALYLVEETNWCVYALFINNEERIKKNCILKAMNQTTNLAYSLGGYLWAISALATEKITNKMCYGNTYRDNKTPFTNSGCW